MVCFRYIENSYDEEKEYPKMTALDWSQCPAVESIPGKRSGAWVFKDTRTPVSVVFDNLEVGATINEIISGSIYRTSKL